MKLAFASSQNIVYDTFIVSLKYCGVEQPGGSSGS